MTDKECVSWHFLRISFEREVRPKITEHGLSYNNFQAQNFSYGSNSDLCLRLSLSVHPLTTDMRALRLHVRLVPDSEVPDRKNRDRTDASSTRCAHALIRSHAPNGQIL